MMSRILFLLCLLSTTGWALPAIEQRDTYFLDSLSAYQMQSVDVFHDTEDPDLFWWAPFVVQITPRPASSLPILLYRNHPEPSVTTLVSLQQYRPQIERSLRDKIAESLGRSAEQIKLQVVPFESIQFEALTSVQDDINFTLETTWMNQTSLFPVNLPLNFRVSTWEMQMLQGGIAHFILNAKAQFPAMIEPRRIEQIFDVSCVEGRVVDDFFVLDEDASAEVYRGIDLLSLLLAFQQCVVAVNTFDVDIEEFDPSELTSSWLQYVKMEGLIEIHSETSAGIEWSVARPEQWSQFFSASELVFTKEFPAEVRLFPFQIGTMLRQGGGW